MTALVMVTECQIIDELLAPHVAALGTLAAGYRSHAFRMLNFMRAFAPESDQRDDRLAIMAALHDLPVMLDGDCRYLERAADLADKHLALIGRPQWSGEIRLMTENHHKCRSYRGPHAAMVEAARRADWIDVSFTRLRFGLPRSFVDEVAAAFPLTGLYPWAAWSMIGRYAIGHPRAPMPMMRW